MFKFRKPGARMDSEARRLLQNELFAFRRTVTHGFPHRPSALAFDPVLRIMAVGTKQGCLCIYGQPGVELSSSHESGAAVLQLFFLPGQGRIVALLEDNMLHLWQVDTEEGQSVLHHVKQFSLEGRLKKISACCLLPDGSTLFLGTEGGNIYQLGISNFKLLDNIIYQDVVMQKVPSEFKVMPGAVESLILDPHCESRLLIGYNRGLIVLWDCVEGQPVRTFVSSQQLESLSWNPTGKKFMSAHSDGSFCVWNVESEKSTNAPLTPYGPYPCKAIQKLIWLNSGNEVSNEDDDSDDDADEDEEDPFILFSGGMPRSSYGDRHTVTAMAGEDDHVVFDFSSRVVDFFLVSDPEDGHPTALVVLAEEEIVAIDLHVEGWPTFQRPYLACIHSSAITCSQHVSDVPTSLWDKLHAAGLKQNDAYSPSTWPIEGGRLLAPLESSSTPRELLLTGHEDGTVMFWEAGGVTMKLLYKLGTAILFGEGELPPPDNDEDEWPPFRKVGSFDPYSDDPRLGVQKIALCPMSATLIVAGTAGQVAILKMATSDAEVELRVAQVNIVSDRESFVWKGHEALTPSPDPLPLQRGFQPLCLLQLSPPASVTALALHAQWQLISVGTAHGFTLFDYVQAKEVVTKCTLNPNDISANNDSAMSRRKSFKKSLRDSIRRLRKRRSNRGGREKPRTGSESDSPASDKKSPGTYPRSPPSPIQADNMKPVERAIEARGLGVTEDAMGSMVRVLQFAQTFLASGQSHTPTLWAGTNQGAIFVFQIMLPAGSKRDSIPVQCHLGKEVQLKHHAPVISITVLDAQLNPLPAPLMVENNRAKAADMSGHHKVLICSEEQFKIFTLPSLKQFSKMKLTAVDGSRIRKLNIVEFRSKSDNSYYEHCICCLTNQGDLCVFSIPQLRRQILAGCLKREDILGISSTIFTRNGQGFYLLSPSEFERFSISARNVTEVSCVLDLAEGARPSPNTPTTPTPDATTPNGGPKADMTEDDESEDEKDGGAGGATGPKEAAGGSGAGDGGETSGNSTSGRKASDKPDADKPDAGGESGCSQEGNCGDKEEDDDASSTPPRQRLTSASTPRTNSPVSALHNLSLSSSFAASADETIDSVRDFPLNLTSSTANAESAQAAIPQQPSIDVSKISEEEADNAANEAADNGPTTPPSTPPSTPPRGSTPTADDDSAPEDDRHGAPILNGNCVRSGTGAIEVNSRLGTLTLEDGADGDTSGDSGLSSDAANTPAIPQFADVS